MMRTRLASPRGLAVAALLAAALPAEATSCARVLSVLLPGQAVKLSDLEPVDCEAALQRQALRHDPLHHLTRARVALAPGDIVHAVPAAALARFASGDKVQVTVRAGRVEVQREALVALPSNGSAAARVLVQPERTTALVAIDSRDVKEKR
jgi:hypothetical protein